MSLPAPARGPESPPDDAAHLLVVDDDMRIRTLLTRFLGSHGFRVTAAASAEEARRKLEAIAFDLLVVDVMMPGESGLEFTEALRKTSAVSHKFRTMRVCEDGHTVAQAQRNDPRVTRFGSFLRRTSLDELPQLFNVLSGTMSLVGPRPHAVSHNEEYRKVIAGYMLRHKVRPGITGWAQVNGYRGETETVEKMQRRVEYDLDYLRNWSLRLDLNILVRTALLVWRDRNAY